MASFLDLFKISVDFNNPNFTNFNQISFTENNSWNLNLKNKAPFKRNERYLQIAFNNDLSEAIRVIPKIPKNPNIIIEAGTPFIKKEGIRGIRTLSLLWGGKVVADLKTMDGAIQELDFLYDTNASCATVLASASVETINLFISECQKRNIESMVDMIGIEDPLSVLRKLKKPPKVIVIHKGRDEESTKGKLIKYRHINKIRSKYDVIISAAGGVDEKEARSAIFNGANIVVINVVNSSDGLTGINSYGDISKIVAKYLEILK